jgi:uncharacterized membrane protein
MNRQLLQWIRMASILLLSVFFLLAGAGKVADPHSFTSDILNYRFFGGWLALPMAFVAALVLPWVEIFAGLGLLWKGARRDAAWILLILLCVFQVALASAWLRGLDIECGCLGSAASTSVQFAFGRNLLLLAAVTVVLCLPSQRRLP